MSSKTCEKQTSSFSLSEFRIKFLGSLILNSGMLFYIFFKRERKFKNRKGENCIFKMIIKVLQSKQIYIEKRNRLFGDLPSSFFILFLNQNTSGSAWAAGQS